ncbi:MAG: hypothetical protein RL398_801, partial [Planctomycetota bacterium]
MTRRPSASRSSASRSASGKAAARAPKARTDGKVDCSCPQCGTRYRVLEEQVSVLIECSQCHRSFKPMTTVGKRARGQDHTKIYIGFGVGIVAIIGIFALSSGGGSTPAPKPQPVVAAKPQVSLGNNPRSDQLVKWAQAIGSGNVLTLQRSSDLTALAKQLGTEVGNEAAALEELQKGEATRYFRELACDTAALASEEALTAGTGKATLYVTPKPGTDDYLSNTRGEIEASFRAEGEQVRVTAFEVKMKPARNPKKPDPSKTTYVPNKDIAAPEVKEISDSAGKRTVKESNPTAVPHWDKATPA